MSLRTQGSGGFPWDTPRPWVIALIAFLVVGFLSARKVGEAPRRPAMIRASHRRRARKWALERERIMLLRDELIRTLGNICANWQSGCETPGEDLEIDHVDGCTWVQRDVSWATRILRYVREYRAGVRLQVLCRRCNGSRNQHTHGTRASRPATDSHPELEEAPF